MLPTSWRIVKLSESITIPLNMETTVESPTKEAVLLVPRYPIAVLERRNAIIEAPSPKYNAVIKNSRLTKGSTMKS